MNSVKLIFVVDDDPVINTLVARRLSSEGYTVVTFINGEDCLKALGRNPDLIILDYLFYSDKGQMMNGMEVFDRIKEALPDLPVIMLSGQEKGEIVLELARKGIEDYIIKDNNLADNLSTVIAEHFKRN